VHSTHCKPSKLEMGRSVARRYLHTFLAAAAISALFLSLDFLYNSS